MSESGAGIAEPWARMLVRRLVPEGSDPADSEYRTRIGWWEGVVSTVFSALLCLVKLIFGFAANSVALIADGLNNLTDVGSSVAVAAGFRMARRPRDRRHPFGYGRAEYISALVLAIAFIIVAIELARGGILRLLQPEPIRVTPQVLAVVVATLAVKAWLACFARALARVTRSRVLEADAWNHGFDIASTALALVALGGAVVGWPAVDGWAAIGVSLFIAAIGVRYARDALRALLGTAPSGEELLDLEHKIKSVQGVRDAHDIVVHSYGDIALVSFHVEVSGALTVYEAHEIAERAEEAVERTGRRAVAHVDPVDFRHPAYEPVRAALQEIVDADDRLREVHDIRVSGGEGDMRLAFDVVVRIEIPPDQYGAVFGEVRERVREKLPAVKKVEIGVEREMASEPMRRKSYDVSGDGPQRDAGDSRKSGRE
ncbi:cation diffusion facilitator family transporter [Kiritimatiella glycovorans]|uniref:cation diffusion facilitator family transporter n=1 Tax=Kiritimatiella glycovorans TaxID=1307763 RepID=UPI0011877322|nr:cation diffusion facilitator family transporter [Kiritimatiella glycovorans]